MAYDEEPNNEGEGAQESNSPGFLARRRKEQEAKASAKDEKTLGKDATLRERATGQAGGKRAGAYARQQAREKEDLRKRLGSTASGLAQKDADAKESDSFFRGGKKKNKKSRSFGGVSMSRRAAAGLAGAGGIGIVLGIFSIFSFLGNFQLEHILNNIDSQTFSRFNATFDRRSDAWMRSYVRLRLGQIGGETADKDEVAFRAWKVDNDNPVRDWFKTMRTSKWEQELFDEQGVVMATRTGPNGIQYVEFEINDEPIPFDILNRYADELSTVDPADLPSVVDFSNKISNEDFDFFFRTQVFDTDAEARTYLRQQSQEKFRPNEVLKRRHWRKDRQNMLGIRDWRFFEKTRTRIEKRQIDIQSRIVNKVFGGNGNVSKFLNCLLDPTGPCVRNADSSNPESQNGNAANAPNSQPDDTGETNDNDTPNDTTDDITTSGTDSADSAEIGNAIDGAGDIDPNAPDLAPSQVFAKELRELLNFAGGPAKIWRWMKRIATVHNTLSSGGGSLIVIAKHARLQNLVAAHTMLTTARDQIRTGEIDGQDFGATMELLKASDWGNSEGWTMVNDVNQGSVSAQAIEQASKNEYCDPLYDPKPTDFAWFCDSIKPNGGSNVEDFVNDYNNTAGKVLGPVASGVNAVNDSPLGGAADWFSEQTGTVANGALSAVGLDDDVERKSEEVATRSMEELVDFFGLAPNFDGSNPGELVNYATGGSAGAAETSTRSSGGMASTPESRAYSTQLAIEYRKEQREGMSLYERYASLDNHESVAARSLFAISTKPLSTSFISSLKNIFSFSWAKSFFLSPANAQATDAQDIADLTGVDKYDIPQVCVEGIDPLSMTIESGTNFDELFAQFPQAEPLDLTWDDVRDTNKFYARVYQWVNDDGGLGDDFIQIKSDLALTIYNCHILDARIQDSLGFTNGYDSGTGLDSQTITSTAGVTTGNITNDTNQIVGADSSKTPCAPGTNDLDVTNDAYAGGEPITQITVRLCAIPGFRSSGAISQPGNTHYVDGADGNVIVNSVVSGSWLALYEAAQRDGIPISSASSYRTMAYQTYLCDSRPVCKDLHDYSGTAKPGTSNHQAGNAVDINEAGDYDAGPSTTCATKQTYNTPTYKWLEINADRFGLGQLANESWHWDASPNGCTL